MRYDFTGKTVLVTGAGHGLGRAIARGFAELGAEVFGVDLDQAELEQTRREAGARCQVRRLDVTDRKAVQSLIAEAVTRRPPGCATCWPSLVEPAERIGDVASARMATCASW